MHHTEALFAKQINWKLTGFCMIQVFLTGISEQILVLPKILLNSSKSAVETLEQCVKYVQSYRSGVFIFVNLKHISSIVLSVFVVNFKAGPQFCNPRDFWTRFSIYTMDWLKHRFLNGKELRNQMLWLGRIGKIVFRKKNEMGKRSKYSLLCFYWEVQTSTK